MRVGPGAALVAFPADVEQAVVDADGQADEQQDVLGGVDRGREPARPREQADRGHDGGQRQAHRDQRGDDRAERHQQDAQGDRDGQHRQPGQPRVEGVREHLVGAGVAGLGDEEPGMPLLDLRDGVPQRLHPVHGGLRVPGHGEADQRGPPVGRRDRLGDPADLGPPVERLGDLGDRGVPVGALDDDHLPGGLLREAGPLDDLLGPPRLPVSLIGPGGLQRPDLTTEDGGADDEHEPADDGESAVPGAPHRDPGRESGDILPVLHGD
ncbi:hypothetical protein GCM10020358_79880 [Amorphoplanes nipponensis]